MASEHLVTHWLKEVYENHGQLHPGEIDLNILHNYVNESLPDAEWHKVSYKLIHWYKISVILNE